MFRQWVDSTGDSNHLPIVLEILNDPKKPARPFKLCAPWLKDEEVFHLIQTNWIPFTASEGNHVASHFAQKFSCIKSLLKDWPN